MPRFAVTVNPARLILAVGLLALGGCYGGGVETGAPLFAAGTQPVPGPTQPAPTQPTEPAPTPTPEPAPISQPPSNPAPLPEPPPAPPPPTPCSEGLAAVDLAGQCRANPPTMGALEAVGNSMTAAAGSTVASRSSLGGARPSDGGNAAPYLIRLWSVR